MAGLPPLSVVIVNWNSRDDLAECLRSLEQQTHDALEIIVVDNGSQDGSAELVQDRFPNVVLLCEGENLGFAEGCNRGISRSGSDWVCMLNNDTIAEPRWAEFLATAAQEAEPECGMLQSKMVFMDRPKTINSTGIVLDKTGSGADRDEGMARNHRSEADEIFCPTAGACAYRRTMLDAIKLSAGWFDKTHFCYLEDLDLGWRARLHGWTGRFVPDSVVLHRYHGTTRRRGKRWLQRVVNTNKLRTIIKNGSWQMLARNVPLMGWRLGRVVAAGGISAGVEAIDAARHALRVRREVEELCKVERRHVEREWIGRDRYPSISAALTAVRQLLKPGH